LLFIEGSPAKAGLFSFMETGLSRAHPEHHVSCSQQVLYSLSMTDIELFLVLVAAHWLADFPLQGDYMAKAKVGALRTAEGTWCLTAHAAIQGLVLGSVVFLNGGDAFVFGLLVFATHWAIDFLKVRNVFGYSADQFLHIFFIAVLVVTCS